MTIVITGASKGIGFELTKVALQNNCKVFAIARNTAPLSQLTNEFDNNLICIDADISVPTEITKIVTTVQQHTNAIDVLINNAGSILNKPFKSISHNELLNVYNTNVFAPFMLTQQLLPMLQNATTKHIVNISSMGGIGGSAKFAGLSAYSSSKGALSILTECLAEELKEEKIIVNALALGAVNTDMLQQAFPNFIAKTQPTQMAEFIYHFATTQHAFFNGKVLPVSNSTP
jgi:3-oxoacyl-[acyl-carrier protein] reductase